MRARAKMTYLPDVHTPEETLEILRQAPPELELRLFERNAVR